MKIISRILIVGFVLFMLFVIFAYFFLLLNAPAIISGQLENLTHKKTSVGYFGITPALKLELKNINVEGQFKAERIVIAPSLLAFVTGNIGFNEIQMVNPEFTYEKFSAAAAQPEAQAAAAAPASAALPAQAAGKTKVRLPLIFKHIRITGARINFIDHTAGREGIKITAKDVFVRIDNLCFLRRSTIAQFEFKGIIPWQAGQEEGRISSEGWIDLYKKDMRASLKIEGIDGIYLYPYYSLWVNLEKSRIEKAKLDFTSNIHGLDNNVVAECHIELRDITFRPRSPDEQTDKAEKIAQAVLKFLQTMDKGKIVLDFTIPMKMTRPEFGMSSVVGAVENKLSSGMQAKKQPLIGDVFALPVRFAEAAVKASSELSKAFIAGALAVGNEVKKATQASFTKEK